MSPVQAVAGSAPVTVTVTGNNFVASSVVNWSGSPRSTTFVSSMQLQATIPASDLAARARRPSPSSRPRRVEDVGGAHVHGDSAPTLTVSATTVTAGSNVTVTSPTASVAPTGWRSRRSVRPAIATCSSPTSARA
jgi:hypothetical protein